MTRKTVNTPLNVAGQVLRSALVRDFTDVFSQIAQEVTVNSLRFAATGVRARNFLDVGTSFDRITFG